MTAAPKESWFYGKAERHHIVFDTSGKPVAMLSSAGMSGEDMERNGRLIAAAPVLADTLRRLVDRYGMVDMPLYDEARALLAEVGSAA